MEKLASVIHRFFLEDKLTITLSEMSEATGVSPSQIRYWEKKGYIHSQQGQKNQNHKYTMGTFAKVVSINYYLQQGFTLKMAYQKQQEGRNILKCIKDFNRNQIHKVTVKDGYTEFDLGQVANADHQRVIVQVDHDGNSKMILRESDN